MKRLTYSTILVASLVLSQHAQSAAAKSAVSPLTEAEKAQCRVQISDFNQAVVSYNADLVAAKALDAEVDSLRAKIDKDQAAIDRRDSAAIQALNAQISKHNDLIARQDQMDATLKAMSSENKQRAAQFSAACENRPQAPSSSSKTPPSNSVCSSTGGADGVKRQIEATFVALRADEKKQQAAVERVSQVRAKARSWSSEKRSKIWLQLLGSPKFEALQREKQPYIDELMRVLVSKPKNGEEECRLVQRIASVLPAIKAINARQYAFMADEIRVAD